MDQIYKLTPKEFADMLKFSTSYIRKLRLAKKLEGWYTVIDGKYFYRVPDKDRPNLVSETPHQNPKFTGSQFRPKKYKSLYYKKKVEDDIYPQQKTLTITMLGMVGS